MSANNFLRMSATNPRRDWVENPQRRSCTQPRHTVTGSRPSVESADCGECEKRRSKPPRTDAPGREGREHGERREAERDADRKRDVDRAVVPPRPIDLVGRERGEESCGDRR